jgi:uncharacterized membrane protein YjfL (UPF0719 family)
MTGQIVRGGTIGIVVGAVVLALAGATLNSIGQSIASLPSLGRSTDTQQLLGWALKGALVGAVSGLIVGSILGALRGNMKGGLMGAIVGAVLLGAGGFIIGTFGPSDRAIDYNNAILSALVGAVLGAVIGLVVGLIVDFAYKRARKRRIN